MKKFIEPQVIITNNYERDELFLLKGITHYAPLLGISHIILPRAASALGWISDLDTDSLKGNFSGYLSFLCVSIYLLHHKTNVHLQLGVNFTSKYLSKHRPNHLGHFYGSSNLLTELITWAIKSG